MEKALNNIRFDFDALKKQYDEHTSRCKQIAEEVEKWGKKSQPQLEFLKKHR